MSRSPRFVLEGACYHIITRGNQRQVVFKRQEDFLKYLGILGKCKKRFRISLYCYCLMSNHVHLVLEPHDPDMLSKAMQSLNQAYTRYFNHTYRKTGHLWQGRYKSLVITKDRYLLDCINYIECNPVRAKIVSTPLEYLWSSYKSRTIGSKDSLINFPKL